MVEKPPKPEGTDPRPRFRERRRMATQTDAERFQATLEKLMHAAKDGMPFGDPKLDDRTVAILAVTFLEEFLRVAIITAGGRMPSPENDQAVFKANGGALSTFANRIRVAEMMG